MPDRAYDGTASSPVSDGTQTFDRDPVGGVLAVKTGSSGSSAWAFTNQHDDVTALFTAASSALVGSVSYAPTGPVWGSTGTQSALGFQGGWTDASTGIVATASRWYASGIGTFTSRDTLSNLTGSAVAANPYAYGNDDPLDKADPSGHFVQPPVPVPFPATAPPIDPVPVAIDAGIADSGPLGWVIAGLGALLGGDAPNDPQPLPEWTVGVGGDFGDAFGDYSPPVPPDGGCFRVSAR